MGRNYRGQKPDIPDHRDYKFSDHKPLLKALPSKVDLRKQCSPVEDQGELGSCTANALVGALEILEVKANRFDQSMNLSRLFVYYNERMVEGTIKEDSGAMIRDGVKVLATYGVCKETSQPYIIKKFKNKPTKSCYGQAACHKISNYYRLQTLNDMKSCLADGFPFVFGFAVYESFESEEVARTGIVQMPASNERCLGGHAVLAVGYDDSTKRFLVRNSWGTDWGIGGYFWMPYNYLTDPNLSDDLWTIRTMII